MWQGTAEILLSPALDGQFFRGDDAQYLLIRNEEEVYGEDVTFFYNITDHVMIYDSGKSAEELEGAISSRQLEEAEEIVTSAGSSPRRTFCPIGMPRRSGRMTCGLFLWR
ncbi:MAG: hypothetical protein ACLR23_06640 [Clostridia bacterium]